MQLNRLKMGAATAVLSASIVGGALFAGVPLASAQTITTGHGTNVGIEARRRQCEDARFCFRDRFGNFRPYFNGPNSPAIQYWSYQYGSNLNNSGGEGADGSGLAVRGS